MPAAKKRSGENKTSPRRLVAHERHARALELRKAGATFPQIATTLGYSNAGAAYKAVEAGIREILQEPAQELITLETSRLDELLRALWPASLRGDVHAIDRVLRLMDRRAKYLGLDAPERVDVKGGPETTVLDMGNFSAADKAKVLLMALEMYRRPA